MWIGGLVDIGMSGFMWWRMLVTFMMRFYAYPKLNLRGHWFILCCLIVRSLIVKEYEDTVT